MTCTLNMALMTGLQLLLETVRLLGDALRMFGYQRSVCCLQPHALA